jgi:hypothetical protein
MVRVFASMVALGVTACTGFKSRDVEVDAALDAPASVPDAMTVNDGDPSLARAPKAVCSTLVPVGSQWSPGFFNHVHPTPPPVSSVLVADQYYCEETKILEFSISNLTNTVAEPSVTIYNMSAGSPFVIEYVVERITVSNETAPTFFGFFSLSGGEGLFLQRHPTTGELSLGRFVAGARVVGGTPLDAFQLPFRVRYEGTVQSAAPSRMDWKLTIRDRSKRMVYQGSYPISELILQLYLGVNVLSPSNAANPPTARLAISDLLLQGT